MLHRECRDYKAGLICSASSPPNIFAQLGRNTLIFHIHEGQGATWTHMFGSLQRKAHIVRSACLLGDIHFVHIFLRANLS